jgi:hypothetical protein
MACAPRTVVLAMRYVHRVRLVTDRFLSWPTPNWTRALRVSRFEPKITQTVTINPSSLFHAAKFVPYSLTDGSNELTLQLSHKGVEALLYVYKTKSTNKTRRRGEGTTTLLNVCPCHWLQTCLLTLLVPFSSVDRKHPSRRPWYDQLLFVFCPL